MIRTSLLALALATTPAAFAADSVVLREALVVDGPHITLGDLFDNAGEAADTVVSRAPAPGARTSLDVGFVRRLAAENDLEWANASGLRRLSVTRSSRAIGPDVITHLIEGELFALEGRTHEIRLANSALSLHAPVDSFGGPQIHSVNFDPRSGMLAVEILPYDGAEPVRVTGRAYATIEIPVLARPVSAGEEVTDADIAWTSFRSDRLRPDAILDPVAVIGLEARRSLRPGEPLRSYDLQRPETVARGELVTLIYEAPGIQLTVRARALEAAADGEMARFVNLQSNRTVEALVDGPGRARVGFGSPHSF